MSEKFETAFSLSLNNDQSTEMYKAEDVKAFVVMYVATLALLSQPLNLPKKIAHLLVKQLMQTN
jgi:hypothetical protein